MSNLNFEPTTKKIQPKTRKQSFKIPLSRRSIIGIVLALIVVIFLGSCIFRKKPDERMQRQLLNTARTWKIPQDKIWKFYCAHDPEGYLIYVEKTRKDAGQDGIGAIIAWQFHAKVQYIDDITGVALYEVYQKHPDSSDEFWSKLPGVYDYAFWADYGGYWNESSIFWTKE